MTVSVLSRVALALFAVGCSAVPRAHHSPPGATAPTARLSDEQLAAVAVIASVTRSIEDFFTLLGSADQRLSEAHIAFFLHAHYDKIARDYAVLLKNIDLEMQFETVERFGTPVTLVACKQRCDGGERAACDLFGAVLARYSSSDVESAVQWLAYKEVATRAIAATLFGQVEAFAVGPIHASADSSIHAHVVIQSVREGSRTSDEYLFFVEYDHGHWHITRVERARAPEAEGPAEAVEVTVERTGGLLLVER